MFTPSDIYEINDYVQAGQSDRAIARRRDAPKEHGTDNVIRFWTVCPWSDALTRYDTEHVYLFSRLLDAETEGAGIDEMARVIFRMEKEEHRDRARRIVASHLARAHWLLKNEFPFLNW